eukprot:scaffold563160_cov42-Prasinocladus_malaysianus.AAC.1
MATKAMRPSTEEGIRVYARDVLDDLLEAEDSLQSTSSLPAIESSKLPTMTAPATTTDDAQGGRAETPASSQDRGGIASRESGGQSDAGLWQQRTLSPRVSASPSYLQMSARRQARIKLKEEEYARKNDEYERNQMVSPP